jgi:hypothetical protein
MARDYGDPNPSDIGDVKPASPTTNFNEGSSRRVGTPDRLAASSYGFDERVDINEQLPSTRHVWAGTILEYLGSNQYSVLLQNGKEVTGIDLYDVPGYAFIEAQSVTVIAGQRQGDFQIVGQKFSVEPTVEHVRLKEVLVPGGHALGKIMISLGDAGWAETDEDVTVYDSFYLNYGLIDEVVPYTYNYSTQTACTVGSTGLIRLGVASGNIIKDASGLVQIYDSVGAVPDAIVEAWLTWMHNNQNVTSGKEVLVRWFTEFERWIIIGREC